MRKISKVLMIVMCVGGLLSAQTSSQDELIVRALYAKLLIALKMGNAHRSNIYSSGLIKSPEAPAITLSRIVTGPVSAIRSQPYESLVTKPSDPVLQVVNGRWQLQLQDERSIKHTMTAEARWSTTSANTEDWSVPFEKVLASLDAVYTRYACIDVQVSFQGIERAHKALFLFGQDASGQTVVLPLDLIVGTSALSGIINESASPDPLLVSWVRTAPGVEAFLQSIRAPGNCVDESLTGMCCDPVSLTCGVKFDLN